MSTIVIRKAGIRRFTISHYAPALSPAALVEVVSKKQALFFAEWCHLRLRQCVKNEQRSVLTPFMA